MWLPGIPRGTTDTRLEGQEVREAQDSIKEDRGQYHNGK